MNTANTEIRFFLNNRPINNIDKLYEEVLIYNTKYNFKQKVREVKISENSRKIIKENYYYV